MRQGLDKICLFSQMSPKQIQGGSMPEYRLTPNWNVGYEQPEYSIKPAYIILHSILYLLIAVCQCEAYITLLFPDKQIKYATFFMPLIFCSIKN